MESPTTPTAHPQIPMPAAPTRNNFFHGKLMDAYHFELETNYLNAKRWLVNRLVAGSGVVCGLDVRFGDDKGKSIVVDPGVAIDYWGREIIVPAKTPAMPIPTDLVKTVAEKCKRGGRREECCVHVVLCYHECPGDPAPVLAGACGCQPECVPGAIKERYCIEFRPGCAKKHHVACRLPEAASPGDIDYCELVKWVTHERKGCLTPPREPCIPLANIEVDVDKGCCKCDPEHIDICIRPIVFSNRLLWDLLVCLNIESSNQDED